MAGADSIVFHVLDVGQGSGNFIEIYEGSNLVSSILIDLGSTHDSDRAAVSAKKIVSILKSMAKSKKGIALIDTLILSHSDSDHINYVKDILGEFNPRSPIKNGNKIKKDGLIISKVYYGAEYSKYTKKDGTNILNKLKKYTTLPSIPTNNIHSFSVDSTNLNGAIPLRTIFSNVEIFILIANTAQPIKIAKTAKKKKKTEAVMSNDVNTCSVVPVISFAGVQYIATGDATGVTLAKCNSIMQMYSSNKTAIIKNVIMMTMPHHGSMRTAFNITGGVKAQAANVLKFSDNIKAKNITASASKQKDKHPSAYLLSVFWQHTEESSYVDPLISPYHYYTAHFSDALSFNNNFPKKNYSGWYTVQTKNNIYTNYYFDDQPQWIYSTNNSTLLSSGTCYTQVVPPTPVTPSATQIPSPLQSPSWVTWDFTTDSTGTTTVTRVVNGTTGATGSTKSFSEELGAPSVALQPPPAPDPVPASYVRRLRPPSHFAAPMAPLAVKPAGLNRMKVMA